MKWAEETNTTKSTRNSVKLFLLQEICLTSSDMTFPIPATGQEF